MPRFVVLQHEHPRGRHWDLMFERGEVLKTWALSGPPDGSPLAAELLADHRRAYLDYEGPISGDRGHVTRWDAGQYELQAEAADRWVAVLTGQRLVGRVELIQEAAGLGRWTWRREE